MIANIYSDMSYSNYPLYQHDSTSSPTTSLSKQSIRTNHTLISNYRQPMMNTTSHYSTPVTSHSFVSNSNHINPQPHYFYQPWKPTRPSNELMLSHETNIPTYGQHNRSNESGMPVDSPYRHRQFNNMYYQEKHHYPTSPPLSTSTSSPNSMYHTQPCKKIYI